jgi:DNA-binding CsgD family transcriptional regulator
MIKGSSVQPISPIMRSAIYDEERSLEAGPETDFEALASAFLDRIAGCNGSPGHRVNVAMLTVEGTVLLDVVLDDVRCVVVRQPTSKSTRSVLSPREQEIARMVSQGYTNKTIAGVLEISLWTVSTHIRRIFAKLGVSNRAAMVALVVSDRRLPDH